MAFARGAAHTERHFPAHDLMQPCTQTQASPAVCRVGAPRGSRGEGGADKMVNSAGSLQVAACSRAFLSTSTVHCWHPATASPAAASTSSPTAYTPTSCTPAYLHHRDGQSHPADPNISNRHTHTHTHTGTGHSSTHAAPTQVTVPSIVIAHTLTRTHVAQHAR